MLKLKKMLKKLQKELIPPFFLKLGKRAKSVNLLPTYESYKKAIKAGGSYEEFDLVYSNDALCYSPNPLFYLDQLLQTNFKKFFLTNILLNSKNEDDIIGLQTSTLATNGVGRNIPSHLGIADREIIYPFTIPSKARVESKIKEYGNIVYNIKEKEATKPTVDGIFDSYGYLITSKNRN